MSRESARLIRYFLAGLTVPENDLWVNLSPYERGRIVPDAFGRTEMGRDLLAQDYILKQITASLMYPEGDVGKRFWRRVYMATAQRYGSTAVPVDTYNKVWIVPDKAVVYGPPGAGAAYILESKLKVMLEEDYVSTRKHRINAPRNVGQTAGHTVGAQIIREIILPELLREVEQGENFACLRQIYNSLILAAWYRKSIQSGPLAEVYENARKTGGISIADPVENDRIYARYLQAFKRGAYSFIKDDTDPQTGKNTPRKYFAGGVVFAGHMQGLPVVVDSAQLGREQGQGVVVEFRPEEPGAGAVWGDTYKVLRIDKQQFEEWKSFKDLVRYVRYVMHPKTEKEFKSTLKLLNLSVKHEPRLVGFLGGIRPVLLDSVQGVPGLQSGSAPTGMEAIGGILAVRPDFFTSEQLRSLWASALSMVTRVEIPEAAVPAAAELMAQIARADPGVWHDDKDDLLKMLWAGKENIGRVIARMLDVFPEEISGISEQLAVAPKNAEVISLLEHLLRTQPERVDNKPELLRQMLREGGRYGVSERYRGRRSLWFRVITLLAPADREATSAYLRRRFSDLQGENSASVPRAQQILSDVALEGGDLFDSVQGDLTSALVNLYRRNNRDFERFGLPVVRSIVEARAGLLKPFIERVRTDEHFVQRVGYYLAALITQDDKFVREAVKEDPGAFGGLPPIEGVSSMDLYLHRWQALIRCLPRMISRERISALLALGQGSFERISLEPRIGGVLAAIAGAQPDLADMLVDVLMEYFQEQDSFTAGVWLRRVIAVSPEAARSMGARLPGLLSSESPFRQDVVGDILLDAMRLAPEMDWRSMGVLDFVKRSIARLSTDRDDVVSAAVLEGILFSLRPSSEELMSVAGAINKLNDKTRKPFLPFLAAVSVAAAAHNLNEELFHEMETFVQDDALGLGLPAGDLDAGLDALIGYAQKSSPEGLYRLIARFRESDLEGRVFLAKRVQEAVALNYVPVIDAVAASTQFEEIIRWFDASNVWGWPRKLTMLLAKDPQAGSGLLARFLPIVPLLDFDQANLLAGWLEERTFREAFIAHQPFINKFDLDLFLLSSGDVVNRGLDNVIAGFLERDVFFFPQQMRKAHLESLVHLNIFRGLELRYFVYYVSQHPKVAEDVRRKAREILIQRTDMFTLHGRVSSLREGPRRVLIVHNTRDGQGDELIRTKRFVEGFLAMNRNPNSRVVIMTERPYLYDNPRIRMVRMTQWRQEHPDLFQDSYDVVVDFWGVNQAYDEPLEEDLKKRDSILSRARISLVVEKNTDEFLAHQLNVDGEDYAASLGLRHRWQRSVYDGMARVSAELGFPLVSDGESMLNGGFDPVVEKRWSSMMEDLRNPVKKDGTRAYPVAIFNPFGGQFREKGYNVMDPDGLRMARNWVVGLLDKGYKVVLAPNGRIWGDRQKAQRILDALTQEQRSGVVIAPSPEEDPTGLKYYVSKADYTLTVEGGMAHLAAAAGSLSHNLGVIMVAWFQRKWLPPTVPHLISSPHQIPRPARRPDIDTARVSVPERPNMGGIDLVFEHGVTIQGGQGRAFPSDPELLRTLRRSSGLSPVILRFEPYVTPRMFFEGAGP